MFQLFICFWPTGDMLYIPQYWWHFVRSYNAPNIALNVWFAMFNFEQQFREAGISEDTDVTKVTCLFGFSLQ